MDRVCTVFTVERMTKVARQIQTRQFSFFQVSMTVLFISGTKLPKEAINAYIGTMQIT